ncbi:putative hydrolase of the HAD superfamily [Lishizhenia tianjinensis]|uniref:Putative hydrolase of the HAD superfamily n=1 Tax=Lishizhenia tianjinensis TaxID=477690 RepID=A0A1I7BEY0_9FLAO|nr:HAD family phosphatase [Lishizhenia tianjinensis]SFT85661.1 putative hydrolase of the HAD superfamily [Lishizhenia tianjinensis]
MKGFDAIIFDLGGVILNIDYNLTKEAFERLGIDDFDVIYSQAKQTDIFDKLETGQISSQHFINKMLDFLPAGTSPNLVVKAWNAMLLDLPQERLDLLAALKEKYTTFLLSNTNEIHVDAFHAIIHQQHGLKNLEDYFDTTYYSNELGKRKPDVDTFLHLCEVHQLNPATTLFIDDSIQHVEGAKEAGLMGYHLTNGETIERLDFLR